MNKTRLLLAVVFAASLSGATGIASAESNEGYWTEPAGGNKVWKSGYGLCWRAGYWTPAMATAECDPDLVKRPAARPAPAPMAKPKPKAKVLAITSTELFALDKSVLTSAAQARLDREVVGRLRQFATIRFINVYGHTDRLGGQVYNQKLSERRAESVKQYLVSKGVPASKIETYGFGKTNPVKSCPDQRNFRALVACLQPNRRVVVEVKGLPR